MSSQKDLLPDEYRYDLRILRDTADQIIRDFQMDELRIIFSEDPRLAFDELKFQLIPFIQKILKNNTAFHALLYRVDIPEKDFRKAMSIENGIPKEEIVAELIIRREFKKVLTRKYFSLTQFFDFLFVIRTLPGLMPSAHRYPV